MNDYGSQAFNPDTGEMTFSSEGKGLYCVAKGVYLGTTPVNGTSNTTPGRNTGYSTYRIPHAGANLLIAIDLPNNRRVGIISTTRNVAPNSWDIKVHCGTTPDADDFDTVEFPVDVWGYDVVPNGPPYGDWGGAVWAEDGTLAWDFSRPNVLWPRALVNMSYTDTVAIPALTRPVMLGFPCTDVTYDSTVSTNTQRVQNRRGAWYRSGNFVTDRQYTVHQHRYFAPEPTGLPTEGDVVRSYGVLLEGALLP